MTRYHLHPTTGEPGRCRATVSCPFGDLTTEHYDSPEAARAGFEAAMGERLLAARHSRKRSPQEALVEGLLEGRIQKLPEGDGRRTLLTAVLARHSEADSPERQARLQWSLASAEEDFAELGRYDLAEALKWARDCAKSGTATAWYQRQREEALDEAAALRESLASWRRKAVEAGVDFSTSPPTGPDASFYADTLRRVEEELGEAEAEALGNPQEEEKALQADRKQAQVLASREFIQKPTPVETGASIYDGVTELTFATPEGEFRTVREVLSQADSVHAGRVSIAQGQALAVVQEAAGELAKLLEVEGKFTLPERSVEWSALPRMAAAVGEREAREARDAGTLLQWDRDQLFPPREGFRMIGSGGENNVYLHEPTQMVFKVPHAGSIMFGSTAQGQQREALVQRAVYLVEERYAGVEGSLERLQEEGVSDVEYLKTYFLHAPSGGRDLPMMVQPKLDMEVCQPLDTYDVRYRQTGRGMRYLSDALAEQGFTDTHDGNVFFNTKTGKVVLLDCLFIPQYERDQDYASQGLLGPEAARREQARVDAALNSYGSRGD